MSHLQRVVVVGSSGSGKTTVATVHRLRTPREVNTFLESLSPGGADPAEH